MQTFNNLIQIILGCGIFPYPKIKKYSALSYMTDSIYNTFTVIDTSISTDRWDDVKSYTSVIQTLQGPLNGNVILNWGTSNDDGEPVGDEDIIATNEYDVSVNAGDTLTRQYDIRTRWLTVSGDFNTADTNSRLVTFYKRTPTEIKFKDDEDLALVYRHEDDDQVLISELNSLKVGLTGANGEFVDSTENDKDVLGNSLYVHFADSNADGLDTTEENRTLAVGLHDSSNVAICATGEAGLTVIDDPTFFPDTDLVIMVDRSNSMKKPDIGGESRYRVVFHTILPTIIDYLNTNQAFAVEGRTRVTLVSYARQEASLDVSGDDLGQSITGARHDELETYFGASLEGTDHKPYRTIIPGAVEAHSTNYTQLMNIVNDVSNILIPDNVKAAVTGGDMYKSMYGYSGSTAVMHHHHDVTATDASLAAYFNTTLTSPYTSGYPTTAILHPATHPYAVLDRLIDGSGVGNVGRWD